MPGTIGPLGRPTDKRRATGNTAQVNALIADLKKRYPGIRITDEFRDAATQAAIRARVTAVRGAAAPLYVAGPNGSHTWGTAIDAQVGRHMWEKFKADMRARGLRAYDEHGHIHVDDRTDLPNGPGERR